MAPQSGLLSAVSPKKLMITGITNPRLCGDADQWNLATRYLPGSGNTRTLGESRNKRVMPWCNHFCHLLRLLRASIFLDRHSPKEESRTCSSLSKPTPGGRCRCSSLHVLRGAESGRNPLAASWFDEAHHRFPSRNRGFARPCETPGGEVLQGDVGRRGKQNS